MEKAILNEVKKAKDMPDMKKSSKKIWIIALTILFIVAVFGIVFFMKSNTNGGVKEKLELGNHYLEEIEYEQALAVFEEVLLIDPENPEAYLGIVEVYIRWNEVDKALEYARKGYEVTGDERLKEKEEMILSGQIYDSQGRELRMTHYEGGKVVWRHDYTYDKNGREIKVALYDAEDNFIDSLDVLYDDAGNCVQTYLSFFGDGSFQRMVCEYDGNLVIRQITYTGPNHDVENQMWEYSYDTEGNLKKEYGYDVFSDNIWELSFMSIYQCNLEGNPIKAENYDANNNLLGYDTWVYDGSNCIEFCSYDTDGKREYKWVYEYDDEGNCVKTIRYDENGNFQFIEE